jgi:hypothetical protein
MATGQEQPTSAPARPGARTTRLLRVMSAFGVLAAAVIAVSANILVARFYMRWDWTSRGLYTPSAPTLETLHSLRRDIEVIVFLSRSDPLSVSVRHTLTAYGAETDRLRPRYVDPDREPAEFIALQQKYGILAGKTEDGRVVTDAAIVVASGDRHWFITSDELVAYDDAAGRARPQLEQALTAAIRNVVDRSQLTICFTSGHGELTVDSGGPTGLAELRYRLEKNNFQVEPLDLAHLASASAPAECAIIVVAGPERPFAKDASELLQEYVKAGTSLLVLADPILSDDETIVPSGLEPVVALAGIELAHDFVIELDPARRLPTGAGESYFATPRDHPVTRAMIRGGAETILPVLTVSQSLRAVKGKSPAALLMTSKQAFAIRDVRSLARDGVAPEPNEDTPRGPLTVAMAAELSRAPGSKAAHGPRVVVVGSSNLVWARNWRDPSAVGNRVFVESAISWLAARPALVSVPKKRSHAVGTGLTEESLGEVMRYVLIYLPGAALALGLLVALRRRSQPKRSRRPAPPAAPPATPTPTTPSPREE